MNSYFHTQQEFGSLYAMLQVAMEASRAKYPETELSLEFDNGLSAQQISLAISETIQELVEQACQRSPIGSQVLITALRTSAGIEIEVADEGQMVLTDADVELRAEVGVPALKCRQAWGTSKHSGTRVFCTNCPQGGVAWTVLIPTAMPAQNAA